MVNENEIEWTTGTDKPYAKVVYEYWKGKLEKKPDKLMDLKHEINSRKKAIDDMKSTYDRMLNKTGGRAAVDLLKAIESHEKALSTLNELYDSYTGKTNAGKDKPSDYLGELKESCESDLRELLKEKEGIGLKPFFETAHARYPSCRKAIKEVEGEEKENKIAWSTLRNRVKRAYPDIYNKAKSR